MYYNALTLRLPVGPPFLVNVFGHFEGKPKIKPFQDNESDKTAAFNESIGLPGDGRRLADELRH
jgi:hypothetical protein